MATREDALLQAYVANSERFLAITDEAFAAAGSWHGGVRLMVESALTEIRRRPGFERVCFEEAPDSADQRMWEARDEMRRRCVELMLAHHGPDDAPELRFEMLAGVLFNAIRDQLATGRQTAEPCTLAATICEVVPVFEPEPVAA